MLVRVLLVSSRNTSFLTFTLLRSAGLALYRALLRICAKPTTIAFLGVAAKDLVQQKFHKYRDMQSPSQIVNSLKAGYEVSLPQVFPSFPCS